jgi:uncharacterized protein (TIGR04255 family)
MSPEKDFRTIRYNRNFLKEVIARIDYVSPIEAIAKELPKDIAKTALKMFPIDEPRPIIEQEVMLSPKGIQATKRESTEWNFYGRNREKRLTITPNTLFVSHKKYESFESFSGEFLAIVNAVFSTFDNAQASRLGLRYVDELKLPVDNPLDWSKYVDNQLLGLFKYEIEGAEFARIFHNMVIIFPNFNIRFQFGIHNPDYPAPIRQKVFVLDFDASYKGLIDSADIPKALEEYHFQLQRLFEGSITDATREVMNAT